MGSTTAPPLVLVADDEPTMLELVARHLKAIENPRLEVIEASDGDEAWRLAREHLPDLVVLDVMMPGMSGWEVCRKIREDVALAHTGVLMLTGIGENLNQMTSPLYGADGYIDKPFDFEELDEKIKVALEARAPQRDAVARPMRNGVGGPAVAALGSTGSGSEERGAGSEKATKAVTKRAAKKGPKRAQKKAPKMATKKKTTTRQQKQTSTQVKGRANMAAKKKTTAKKAGAKAGAKTSTKAGAKTAAKKKTATKKASAPKKTTAKTTAAKKKTASKAKKK